jgi:hypothetical protein
VLLPLFEENADFWEAIGYLNVQGRANSFGQYLQTWHDNAPEDYRDLIRYIMALFGVLPRDPAGARRTERRSQEHETRFEAAGRPGH